MAQIDGNICPLCRSHVQLYQINEAESVKLCSNHTCEYPFGHTDLEYYDTYGALDNSSSECLKWLDSSEFLNECLDSSLDHEFWLDALEGKVKTVNISHTKKNDKVLFFENAISTHTPDKRGIGSNLDLEIVCPTTDTSRKIENVFQLKLPKRTYSNLNRIKDPKYVKKLKMIDVMYGKNIVR